MSSFFLNFFRTLPSDPPNFIKLLIMFCLHSIIFRREMGPGVPVLRRQCSRPPEEADSDGGEPRLQEEEGRLETGASRVRLYDHGGPEEGIYLHLSVS
jgi:hypothetical protein